MRGSDDGEDAGFLGAEKAVAEKAISAVPAKTEKRKLCMKTPEIVPTALEGRDGP